MVTKQPSPHFPIFVSFQTHLKLTLSVGRTGWAYTAWIKRKLEVMVVGVKGMLVVMKVMVVAEVYRRR